MFRKAKITVTTMFVAVLVAACGSGDAAPRIDTGSVASAAVSASGGETQLEFDGTLPKPCTLVSKSFAAQTMGGDVKFGTIDGAASENKGVRAKTCTYYQNSPRVEVDITTLTYHDIEAAWAENPAGAVNISGEPTMATEVTQIGDQTIAAVFDGSNNMAIVAFRRGGVAVKVVVQDPREGATASESAERAYTVAKKAAEAQF